MKVEVEPYEFGWISGRCRLIRHRGATRKAELLAMGAGQAHNAHSGGVSDASGRAPRRTGNERASSKGDRLMSDDLPTDGELPLSAVGREHPGNEVPPDSEYVASTQESAKPKPPGAVPREEPGN
jgi:hypothetical protein